MKNGKITNIIYIIISVICNIIFNLFFNRKIHIMSCKNIKSNLQSNNNFNTYLQHCISTKLNKKIPYCYSSLNIGGPKTFLLAEKVEKPNRPIKEILVEKFNSKNELKRNDSATNVLKRDFLLSGNNYDRNFSTPFSSPKNNNNSKKQNGTTKQNHNNNINISNNKNKNKNDRYDIYIQNFRKMLDNNEMIKNGKKKQIHNNYNQNEFNFDKQNYRSSSAKIIFRTDNDKNKESLRSKVRYNFIDNNNHPNKKYKNDNNINNHNKENMNNNSNSFRFLHLKKNSVIPNKQNNKNNQDVEVEEYRNLFKSLGLVQSPSNIKSQLFTSNLSFRINRNQKMPTSSSTTSEIIQKNSSTSKNKTMISSANNNNPQSKVENNSIMNCKIQNFMAQSPLFKRNNSMVEQNFYMNSNSSNKVNETGTYVSDLKLFPKNYPVKTNERKCFSQERRKSN